MNYDKMIKNSSENNNNDIIYTVSNKKTNIRGFWKSDNEKLFVDNIKIEKYNEQFKKDLFTIGELAVFYIKNNKAIIENKNGSIIILKNNTILKEKTLKCSTIKKILINYGACTIFKINNEYHISIWY